MIHSVFKFVVESYQNSSSTGASGLQPQMNTREGSFVDALIELGKWLLVGVVIIGAGFCFFVMRSSRILPDGRRRPNSNKSVDTSHSLNAVGTVHNIQTDHQLLPPPPPYRELPEPRSTEIHINAEFSNFPAPSAPSAPITSDSLSKPLIMSRTDSSTRVPVQQTNVAVATFDLQGKIEDGKNKFSFRAGSS